MPEPLGAAEAAEVVLRAEEEGRDVAVVTVIEPAALAGIRIVVAEGEVRGGSGDAELDRAAVALAEAASGESLPVLRAVEVPAGARVLYVEAHRARESLLVVGAGHIAVPLARLGVELGFRVTVLDDREAFATPERFAPGVRVLRADFERDPFEGVRVDGRSYVALVTRGHRWDYDCLRRLLERPEAPRYIGMIGSRRRVRAAFHALLAEGFTREALSRIHAPIGLDVGAETPEEIAVSIAAELVQVRRGGEAGSRSRRERVLERLLPEATGEHG